MPDCRHAIEATDPTADQSAQIETARRFTSGDQRQSALGEAVYGICERDAPSWLVLEGAVDITRRERPDHEVDLVAHGVGQITGEISQLSGAPSLTSSHAGVHVAEVGLAMQEQESGVDLAAGSVDRGWLDYR